VKLQQCHGLNLSIIPSGSAGQRRVWHGLFRMDV
jgi:hypothetical protein